ncbi:MAG: rhodanese-like domain-containing protein [Deltaproteobacteria bacterium]|nr:rhodanese-like domain-containing protein [Deltaproteobacteria bacterium]
MAAKHNPGFEKIVDSIRHNVTECTVAQVHQRLQRGDAFHFVDVREDSEVAVDRAQGAVHLGRGVIERDIESLVPDKNADLVLYCGGGYRSALAADSLQKMGYTNVKSMAGGIRAWREAGLPVETGPVRKL